MPLKIGQNFNMNFLILICLGSGITFLMMGWIQKRYSPKCVNSLYGYKTSNTFEPQESWGFAHKYSADKIISSGLVVFFISIIFYFIELEFVISLLVGTSITLISVIWVMVSTEKAIKENSGNKEVVTQQWLGSTDSLRSGLKNEHERLLLQQLKIVNWTKRQQGTV